MSEFLASDVDVPRDDVTSPPMGYLLGGAASVVAGLLLLPDLVLAARPEIRHLLGWLLSSMVTIVLVVASRRQLDDLRSNADTILVVPRWRPTVATAVLVAGLLVAAAHSWRLATEWAA